jgi:putative ABC transport system substrate-binding protein
MRRRDFIEVIAGSIAALPLAARAQQPEQMRRIGVLMNRAANDPDGQARLAAFKQKLQQLGWTDGGNVRIDTRWGEDDVERERRYAAELLALGPDVILASGTLSVAPLQRSSRTFPIVFVGVVDPIGGGIVNNLARPGGNATGFLVFEYSLSGKWLDLLRQVAPGVRRVAVLRDPDIPSGTAMFGVIQSAAQSVGLEVNPIGMRDAGEIERAVEDFARSANGGLIVTTGASVSVHRDLIVTLAARHKLPAVYAYRFMVAAGGLMSYSPDQVDEFRRAAGYVYRILRGEKPGDLPVQAPTKYELVINLKTAKALGLSVPQSLLSGADEVIE